MSKTVTEKIQALETRIKADTAKLAELKASQAASEALANLKQGDVIQFNYGRGETRGTFSGEVRAVFDTDKGKKVKVIKGEGADEEIVTISPSDIVAVGEEAQEADAPLTASQMGLIGGAAADPLASIN